MERRVGKEGGSELPPKVKVSRINTGVPERRFHFVRCERCRWFARAEYSRVQFSSCNVNEALLDIVYPCTACSFSHQ